jgi:hypothetical protein
VEHDAGEERVTQAISETSKMPGIAARWRCARLDLDPDDLPSPELAENVDSNLPCSWRT